ncbi:hypothetical protein ILUMI_25698 [Ignelater luminosus]|uniref:PiggyBac transposable element-derived protein domain-containing protein n=1 Tax=Ignelater luminosus TaxID=2038154 RepID=A0A8K0FZN7_IGNLU|nr:hypothetical protein ILUMI_25698 [Ignelater luminosus]
MQFNDEDDTQLDVFAEPLDEVYITDYDEKSKILITPPKPVADYNKGIRGVDKMDQLVAAYRTRMQQRQWWLSFRYRASSLLKFRRSLAMALLITHGTPSLKSKIVQSPSDDIRYDERNHLIDYNETEKRCKSCDKKVT